METTFITIHNLTPEANIMYVSDSISDILEFEPQEVMGKSCFDYFHPDDLPFARSIHSQGVYLEKAAVIHYARIKKSNGQYQECECVFTVVYDVMVACTSIYRDKRSKEDRNNAEAICKHFTSPPKDPRYHMLEHLSSKFRMPTMENIRREPRAALMLNRFTRTLTVMFCTDAIAKVLGINKEYMLGKSFYDLVSQDCLRDAISSIESAKGNDSIAYLRFWCRDPRFPHEMEELNDALEDSDIESDGEVDGLGARGLSSLSPNGTRPSFEPIQLEAVISCTSDGLVVILRKAPALSPNEGNQMMAAPWGVNPIRPHTYSPVASSPFQHGPDAPEKQPDAPDKESFLKSIREVAVFAWALAGINGNIAAYGKGKGRAEAVPPALPIYNPYGPQTSYQPPVNRAKQIWEEKKAESRKTKHSIGFLITQEREGRKRRRLNNDKDSTRKSDHYDIPKFAPQPPLTHVVDGVKNGNGNGWSTNGRKNGTNGYH